MANGDSSLVSLLAHPHTPAGAVRRISACARPIGAGELRLEYALEADLRRVRIPTPMPHPGRADRLWTHTCFEAFVSVEGSAGYLELNFSPSGQWAAYRFDSYREGMAAAELAEAPQVRVHRSEGRLELLASVRMPAAGRLRLALSAVVEEEGGGLSYWALRHPAGRPDFHHPESFSLELESPRNPHS